MKLNNKIKIKNLNDPIIKGEYMDKDKRTGWLRELKVGDTVYKKSSGTFGFIHKDKIKKISPTGRITLEHGCKYDATGELIQKKDKWSSFHGSSLMTKEEAIEDKKRMDELNKKGIL